MVCIDLYVCGCFCNVWQNEVKSQGHKLGVVKMAEAPQPVLYGYCYLVILPSLFVGCQELIQPVQHATPEISKAFQKSTEIPLETYGSNS